jgi:hypothetical protein
MDDGLSHWETVEREREREREREGGQLLLEDSK